MTAIFLASIYIGEIDKEKAEKTLNEIDTNIELGRIIVAIINIWNNRFESLADLYPVFELKYKIFEGTAAETLILLLLAKKQYHFVFKLFQSNDLDFKNKCKPIYYALMHYLKDEYPNEYLKMGDELKQPVEDVMERIKQMAIDYA